MTARLRKKLAVDPSPFVEIVRSFSYKLNAGNYESRDFFCSQKAECLALDAERVSRLLHDFCKQEVMRAVREWKLENQGKVA